MNLNNKGRARILIILCALIIAFLVVRVYVKKLADEGKIDPEIVKIIEDPLGATKDIVDQFNAGTRQRMDSYNSYN